MKTVISVGVLALLLATPAMAGEAGTPFANQTIQQPVQDRVTGEDTMRVGTKADPSLKSGSDEGATTRGISSGSSIIESPAHADGMTGGLRAEPKRTY